MKKLSLHWKIIIGMFLGVAVGLIFSSINGGNIIITNWVKPFGTIFINSLKLIAIPLILASLIKGISDLKDISKLSSMGGLTITTYLTTTVIAVSIGLLVVNGFKPGNTISDETRTELVEAYSNDADQKREIAQKKKESGPLQPLVDLVPSNFLGAASDNKNMLQVIFFSILFGIAMILIPETKSKPVKSFFDSLNDVILKIIDLIMLCAPYGVFALLASLIVEAPNIDLLKSLLLYSVTLLAGLFIVIIVYLMIVKFFLRRNLKEFIDGILPAQLVAFSTSSSAATLPVTMDRVHNHLGVKKEVSSFVLPIGATINMDGTAVYQAVAAVFIAQAFGLELSLVDQLGIISTATLASIGAAAVPSAGIIVLVIVLAQAGIPEAGLALIFAVDRPLDMFRTVVNVTGDAMVSLIVSKFQKS
ncbi:MAG: dicarboxylate/amino acid:cation symporter [Flavobacteriaceae bacterium]|nr:dicarboxylate/amino acid:cation symporter [Flavobacteriaceae bacterium]MBL6681267.1 dicarboxylate/amino acid:cation symporter [Flavobacteriaceae bacterium]